MKCLYRTHVLVICHSCGQIAYECPCIVGGKPITEGICKVCNQIIVIPEKRIGTRRTITRRIREDRRKL